MGDILEKKVFELHDRRKLAPSQIDEVLKLSPGTARSIMIDIWKNERMYSYKNVSEFPILGGDLNGR